MTAPVPPYRPLAEDEFGDWLNVCGPCDGGLPQPCICPPGDPRSVILTLVERVDRVLALCGDADTGWPAMVAKMLRGESPHPPLSTPTAQSAAATDGAA